MNQFRTHLYVFILSLFFVSLSASTQHAFTWLDNRANAEHNLSSPLSLSGQSASELLETVRLYGREGDFNLSWVGNQIDANANPTTEMLARKASYYQRGTAEQADLLDRIITCQNFDGGYGELIGYDSTVLDTAFALQALRHNPGDAAGGVSFLISRQNSDGGWTDENNPSSVYVTAQALQALWYFRHSYDLSVPMVKAKNFLLAQLGTTGAEPFVNAKALIGLLPTLSDRAPVITALGDLNASQRLNGSWEDDPFSTALALQALYLAAQPVTNPDLGSVTVHVVDASSLLPLSGVKMTLTSSDANYTTTTGTDGFARMNALNAGSYALMLEMVDYVALGGEVTLGTGENKNLGSIQLYASAVAPSTGTVRGIVTDHNTNQPLEGVEVTAGTQTTFTDADGAYQLSGVPAGNVTISTQFTGYYPAKSQGDLQAGSTLLFSPGLIPENTPNPTIQPLLFGTVTDAASGLPLEGVLVVLSGANEHNLTTTVTGGYLVEPLVPGETVVTVSKTGYDAVKVTLNVTDVSQIRFSPTLYFSSSTPSGENSSSVTGTLIDSVTNQPIADANVTATLIDGMTSVLTDSNGVFTIDGIVQDLPTFSFVHDAYKGVEFMVSVKPLDVTDIGQVRLKPLTAEQLLPDLLVNDAGLQQLVCDQHTLELAASIDVNVTNAGNAPTSVGFAVSVYSDANRNGQYDTQTDVLLGTVRVNDLLAISETINVSLPLQGTLPFVNAPLSIQLDSTNDILESDESNNLIDTSVFSRHEVSLGQFQPTLKWEWSGSTVNPDYKYVMSAPVVAPLIDTNNDGLVNELDVPAILFITYPHYTREGIIRAVRGDTGEEIFTITERGVDPFSQLAVGDINNDGHIEIIVPGFREGILAFDHNGKLLWENTAIWHKWGWYGTWGGASIADIDADGTPEIIFGANVLNNDGTILWKDTSAQEATWGPISIAADLDLDGKQEIIIGRTAYNHDGTIKWQSSATGYEGYPAVVNIDNDDYPEVIVSSRGRVHVMDHLGNLMFRMSIPSGGVGAPPTVADFDNDGLPEFGVVGNYYYTVFDTDGSILWSSRTSDRSSGTGASVFDFDNDGQAEVVYGDEVYLRVYDGATGEVIYQIHNGSSTACELPVIADVDNDGHADIVMSNTMQGPNLRVFQDANNTWANTRKIWNQHAYHITNVNDDGSIPKNEKPSWLSHNTYRQNILLNGDPLAAPDLSVSVLRLFDYGSVGLSLKVRAGNGGALAAASEVSFFDGDPAAGGLLLGTLPVSKLGSGEYEDVELHGLAALSGSDLYAVVDYNGTVSESDETNNAMHIPYTPFALNAQVVASTDAPSYGPESDVQLSAAVTNTGNFDADYSVTMQIEDLNGVVVERFVAQPVSGLLAGAGTTVTQMWNTGVTLSGSYVLRATLSQTDGTLIDESTVTFAITATADASAVASLRVLSDKAVYHTTDTVQLDNLVRNLTVNTLLDATTLRVSVADANGSAVFADEIALEQIVPEGSRKVPLQVALNQVSEGVYRAEGVLLDGDGIVIANDATTFEVREDLRLSVRATSQALLKELERGTPQECRNRLINTGTTGVSALPVQTLVVGLDDNASHFVQQHSIDVGALGEANLTRGVDTATLAPGRYACMVQTMAEGAWHTAAYDDFEVFVPPIDIAASLQTGGNGRLLVLLDAGERPDDEHGDHDGDDEEHDEHGKADNDPYGPASAPALAAQRAYLEALLERAGYAYRIVEDADAFEDAFRTGGYNGYVLMGEAVKLSETLQDELRQAVLRGEGLLVSGIHDWRNGRLDDALGIAYRGKEAHATGIDVAASELYGAAHLDLNQSDKVVRFDLEEGVQTVALYSVVEEDEEDDKHAKKRSHGYRDTPAVAMSTNRYGAGDALFAGFDLLAYATQSGEGSGFEALLLEALHDMQPDSFAPYAGGIVPLHLHLENLGVATPGQTVSSILNAPDAQLYAAEGNLSAAGELLWRFELAENAAVSLPIWLAPGMQSAAVTLETAIYTGTVGALSHYDTLSYTLQAETPPTLADVAAQTSVLGRKAEKAASALLNKAMRYEAAGQYEKALSFALKAAERLEDDDSDAAQNLRYTLAWAIKALGMKTPGEED